VIGTLAWEFQVTLPLMASKVFHGGGAAYGVMASVMGVGAVIGGLVSASRPRPRARALCLAAIGWGIAILAAAAAPSLPLELATMLFVGYGSITFNSFAKTTLQLAATPTMRGRVMALWGLAWLGSTPIGGAIVGWVGQTAGPAGPWSSAGCRRWPAGCWRCSPSPGSTAAAPLSRTVSPRSPPAARPYPRRAGHSSGCFGHRGEESRD
jgi:MFS family permease